MKVLHIINNIGFGGAEKLIEESLPIMKKEYGIEVDLLLLNNNEMDLKDTLIDNGIKINVIPRCKFKVPLNILHIRNYIKKNNYDIVHVHLFPGIYWISIVAKLMLKNKPKFIMTEHSTYNRRREKKYLRYLEKSIYYGYDKIISISKMTQKKLVEWLNPKEKYLSRFVIINNGINVDKFNNAEPYEKMELNKDFDEKTILLCMIGRFAKSKDQVTIIRALKNLNKDIHLLLIGEGPLINSNQELSKELGVGDRVHFLGYRSDVERILKTVDIVIQSSNWEGFGLAAAEGMAAEKPVIASDIPGLREVVDGAGILFENGNEVELVNIINKLIKDSTYYDNINNACINRVELFDISIMVKSTFELYEDILSS